MSNGRIPAKKTKIEAKPNLIHKRQYSAMILESTEVEYLQTYFALAM